MSPHPPHRAVARAALAPRRRVGNPLGLALLATAWAALSVLGQTRLDVELLGTGEVRLSWPATGTDGLGLQEAPTVGPKSVWAPVPTAPRLEATRQVVDVRPSVAQRFFRLAQVETGLTRILSTSPATGEERVAVTRETIIRLTAPLAPDVTVGNDGLYASFGGRQILSRIQVSADRSSLTLFYLEPLPGGARVRVTLQGTGLRDDRGREVDVDGDGQPGGTARIDFVTLALQPLEDTSVTGRVFASELADSPTGQGMSIPLAGVTITVDGQEETLRTVTDTFGNFRLAPVPPGDFFVHVDGRTALRTAENDFPEEAYYPFVGKRWTSVPGEETSIGNVYLPLIAEGSLQPVSVTADTTVTFPDSVLFKHPELEGVALSVPANALFADDGSRGGQVGIAPVPPDRLPSPLPRGLMFPLVITVQTDGPSNFDAPVPVCFPNLPDPVTGAVKAPGTPSALWSFNHDLGDWEVVAPMTVSADGRLVCSDPGYGILQPGWHGEAPGSTASGGDEVSGGGSEDDQEPENGGPNDASDPVYLFSGEFHCAVEDLRILGRGIDFAWIRKYRSKIGPNTAQGNGWDYSYNASLESEGEDVILRNGHSRTDRYSRQPDGTFSRRGYFRELVRNPDGSHTLTFEDTGRWEFLPFDGTPAAGRLARIFDRNGNRLQLAYDALGRLARVTDTLDRDITIAYDGDGRIASVTDFAGRSVRYAYYDGLEPGGSAGDLKSVTTPVVAGTPTGNDFPEGKTTTYTYTTGFADDRLNHNLVSITDARRNDPGDPTYGQGPYLINTYSPDTDPASPDFDRVVRQELGGDLLDYVYVPQLPSNANDQTVVKTIANDRNGNVKEYFYDRRNRMVRMREYTGRADPRQPTTEVANRPAGRLRPTDPRYFETRYEWNEDSLQKRVIHPNGTLTEYVYESDLHPSAPPRLRGNLRILRQRPGSHLPAGDQAVIEERYEHDLRFGGSGFMTRITDARGNTTEYTYDARGNCTQVRNRIASIVEDYEYNAFGQMVARVLPDNGGGHRRRDEFTYYDAGPQRGYLRRKIVDASRLGLTTTYAYDAVGNLVGLTDPRGNETRYLLNAQNQLVREISREVTPGSGLRYQRDQFYDANNNLVRVDLQNFDDAGNLRPNSHISLRYDYEFLNFPIRVAEEVDATREVIEEYGYDGNRNRVLTRYGEAVNGRQPTNQRATLFDERDLEYRVILAPGDPAQSTTQYDYDGNGNLVAVHEGLEDAPRTVRMTYDGYNRPIQVTDPLGNVQHTAYDAADNRVRSWFQGELLDGPGAAGNVRLSDVRYVYDPMNRVVRTESQFFDATTQTPLAPGTVVAELEYNGLSEIVRLVDGNGNEERREFDTANRLQTVTDPQGNTATFAYDANDNIVSVTEVEIPDLGGDPETFVTTFAYDGLDRRIQTRDSAGNLHTFGYDSRHNLTQEIDARGTRTRYEFDGLNRLLLSRTLLTADGTGDSAEVGSLVLRQTWDDSHRLRTQTDPNDNSTTYDYDPLNREVRVTYADGTSRGLVYDVHHNVVQRTDANRSVRRSAFDLLNRTTRVEVTPGPGVSSDTAFETFAYDGLSRVVRAEDDDSLVTRVYDSFGRVLAETQNGKRITATLDPLGNLHSVTYPGGRVITVTYDALNRRKTIGDAEGLLAAYDYVGPHRVQRRRYGNGTATDYEYDGRQGVPNAVNDHGVKRIVRTRHSQVASGITLENLTYTWDRSYNKSSRTRTTADGDLVQQFNYDSLQRLVQSATSGGVGPARTVEYDLDLVGNRRAVVGGSEAGTYTRSAVVPEPADAPVNQYTTTPGGARRHDANGNLTRTGEGLLGERDLRYDYRNQMVEHVDAATGQRATYAYDPLGRRIAKTLQDGATSESTRYYYLGWQVCEEQDDAGATLATYVYGNYLDEVLSMRRGGVDYFYHADDQFNVVSLTDGEGNVVERYEYEDYGLTHLSDPSGFPRARSAVGNPYRFSGRRWDDESGFYFFRTRYLEARTGRFTTRDTLGIWGDPVALGNGYTYVGNNPWTSLDPMGQGLFQMLMGNNWDDPDGELFEAAGEGLQGGASILANTMTFGGSDALGVTNSEQYQGREYDLARFSATVSREALLAAITGGAAAARGGACALQGMGRLAPLIEAIQASKHGPKIASLMHKILEAINTGRDAADLVRELRKLTNGNGSLFNAIISGLGVLSGIDGLRSLPGFCFAEETLVATTSGFTPISAVQVGDELLGPEGDETTLDPSRTSSRLWVRVELRLEASTTEVPSGMQVTLLRPATWPQTVRASVGDTLYLRLPGLPEKAGARVTSISPPFRLLEGGGPRVRGTFHSRSSTLVLLDFDGIPEPLRATPSHPIYSLTRQDWVAAGQLQPGEEIKTRGPPARLLSRREEHGDFPVYNLEVEGVRVYHVSSGAILAHNNCAAADLPPLRGKSESEVRQILTDSGFTQTKVSNSAARNEVWRHPDGSEVRVHPYGNQSGTMANGQVTPKSGLNAHVHKQNPAGQQLTDRGIPSTDPNQTHIGIPNPPDLPAVRGRPHGSGR